ncbi:hypothetical protein D3C73_1200800 [compost metagenome]
MPVVVRPQPWFVLQARGQAMVPAQHIAVQLFFPGNARQVAGQPGAVAEVGLQRGDRVIGADQVVACHQQMGTALRGVVAGCRAVQRGQHAPCLVSLGDVSQR